MAAVTSVLDVGALKKDFPLLSRGNGDRPLVYLDSAASAQRPQAVLDAMDVYYTTTHANVHRGVYAIAEEATRQLEAARVRLGRFIGAPHPQREIVFTKNATEAINLVAFAWGRQNLGAGDVVVLSEIEHHANLVPWLMLQSELGFEIRYLPLGGDFHLDLTGIDRLVDGAKLVGGHRGLERARHGRRPRPGRHRGPRRRRARARRRGAARPAPPRRRRGHGDRLLRSDRPQDARADRDRRALGPGRAARCDAAVPRRWRDDPRRAPRRLHAERAALEVRGGDAADRRGDRARRRRRLPRDRRDRRRRRPRDRPRRLRARATHRRLRRDPDLRPGTGPRSGARA